MMTKKILFLLCAYLFSLNIQAQSLTFYQEGFEKMQAEAQKAKKSYIVYFYGDDCATCDQLETKTFAHKNIKSQFPKRYWAYKAKAFSVYGDALMKMYDVKKFPQICIFTPDGKLVERLEGYQSPQKVLTALQRNQYKAGKPKEEKNILAEGANPALSLKLQTQSEFKGIFKFRIQRFEEERTKAMGIQLGVFEDYQNVVKAVLDLGENWHDNILVTQHEVNAKVYFRLILGPFYSIEHALSYQKSLKEKKGLYGLLINLDSFNAITIPENSSSK